MSDGHTGIESIASALAGRYRLDRELGRGGMGVVYHAWDIRHDRPVAVKMISEAPRSSKATGRFLWEIRAAARLSHPNIVPLIDSGEVDGWPYYIVPFVAGESLRDRLKRQSRLAVDEAVGIGIQLSDALAHAHRHGIIHRDVKPGNVLLDAEGHARLSDFGIALALDRAGEVTGTDSIVGTRGYMSPELMTGGELDARSDVYSLGCVLYEMLAGDRPAVSRGPRPLRSFRADVPRRLDDVVHRALAWQPEERYANAELLRDELIEIARDLSATSPTGGARRWSGKPRRRDRRVIVIAAGAFAAAVAALAIANRGRPPQASGEFVAFGLQPPPGVMFTSGPRNVPAVSPDGREIVFVGTDSTGRSQIWIKSLSSIEAMPVPDTDAATMPFWSPDATSIGFFVGTRMRAIERRGVSASTLASTSTEPRGGSWGPAGLILFSPNSNDGVYLLDPAVRDPVRLTVPDTDRAEIGHVWSQFLEDGERFVYYVTSSEDSVAGIYIASLNDPIGRRLTGSAASGIVAAGRLLYLAGSDLVEVSLDALQQGERPEPAVVAVDVASTISQRGAFSASPTALALSRGEKDYTAIVRVDADGSRTTVGFARPHRHPAITADGRLLAVEILDGAHNRIEILDLQTDAYRPLPGPGDRAHFPEWAPDGDRLAFASERPGGWTLRVAPLRGGGQPVDIVDAPTRVMPTSWFPDGERIVFAWQRERGDYDIYSVGAVPGDTARPLVSSPHQEVSGRVSPTGRWLAYVSDESGAFQVYARSLVVAGLKCTVSGDGGFDPLWGDRTDRLHFLSSGGALMEVDLQSPSSCPSGPPRRTFATNIDTPRGSRNSYVQASGVFYINERIEDVGTREISILLNWTARPDG